MLNRFRTLPRTVWVLGLVSLFMDLSSEMIHGLLPVFLVAGLGASPVLVGLIEGIAEATAAITKVFSGWLSDRLGRRKMLTVLGYGVAALTKPIFPLAVSPYEVLGARFIDRIGKGIRGAPRDALLADVTPEDMRGAAYGLRQSLDNVGAFLGPLAAICLMAVFAGDMRTVFGFAVIPAAIAVVLLLAGLSETAEKQGAGEGASPIGWRDLHVLGTPFWLAVAVGVLFTMARFSEAFLVLKGTDAGLPLSLAPLTLIVMNVVYAIVSAPAGSLSDSLGRRFLLALGIAVLVVADLTLAWSGGIAGALVGIGLWGLHLGLTQGLLSALVADAAPAALRGTAFGIFNLASGVAMLAASSLAGLVWASHGAPATFLTGAAFAVIALGGALTLLPKGRRERT